jgi:hypothetical protein
MAPVHTRKGTIEICFGVIRRGGFLQITPFPLSIHSALASRGAAPHALDERGRGRERERRTACAGWRSARRPGGAVGPAPPESRRQQQQVRETEKE